MTQEYVFLSGHCRPVNRILLSLHILANFVRSLRLFRNTWFEKNYKRRRYP
jgi:hypothetical protein